MYVFLWVSAHRRLLSRSSALGVERLQVVNTQDPGAKTLAQREANYTNEVWQCLLVCVCGCVCVAGTKPDPYLTF